MITDDGRNYRLLSCALRNAGTGWKLINDSAHQPTGITDVITHPSYLEIVHDVGAIAVSSVQIVPDEYLAARGYRAGMSVGLNNSRIEQFRGSSTTPLAPATVVAPTGNWWITGYLIVP